MAWLPLCSYYTKYLVFNFQFSISIIMYPDSNRRMPPRPIIGLFFLAMFVLFGFILGNIIAYLWNTILVAKTGVQTIAFWEAIGLFILCRILFGGFRFHGRSHIGWRRKRKIWREKWVNMNEEEKAAFKANWRNYCNERGEK